ncbi:MAG: hypothetical protein PUF72_10095 [Clostridiales bacterium]|nr:hypothetical protein [Clostridiales bacterium]
MIYNSNDPGAILAMERARLDTRDFGADIYDEDLCECPVCGALYPSYFYMNSDEECIGCEMCVYTVTERF